MHYKLIAHKGAKDVSHMRWLVIAANTSVILKQKNISLNKPYQRSLAQHKLISSNVKEVHTTNRVYMLNGKTVGRRKLSFFF